MIRLESLDTIPPMAEPICLTIGNFDGVHKGHQSLIKALTEKGGSSVVITFSNHPSTLFRPENPTPLLIPLSERLNKLETLGVTCTVALPFTREIANLSWEAFLERIRSKIPFKELLLGEGATFGKGRGGTKEALKAAGIPVTYLPKYFFEGEELSSSRIRSWFESGQSKRAGDALELD